MMSETITWYRTSELAPDDETTVLINIEGGSEPVWVGYLEGGQWRDVDSTYIVGAVTAWAYLPGGVKA